MNPSPVPKPRLLLTLTLALLSAAVSVPLRAATPMAANETGADAEARAIDAAIARHPLFAMLAEDQPVFRKEWDKRYRLRNLRPPTGSDPDSVRHIGLGLAMDAARPYLMRASDDAANRFLMVLGRVIAEGEKDAEVCLAYVETGGNDDANNVRRETVESKLGSLLMQDMIESLEQVVASGRAGEKRVLSRQELPPAIQPVILEMAEKNGVDSLQGLAKVNDRGAAPQERCRAMAQMLDAFAAQPEPRRAMLARTLFSGALPRLE